MLLLDDFLKYIKIQKRYSKYTEDNYRNAVENYITYIFSDKLETANIVEVCEKLTDQEFIDTLNVKNLRGFIAYLLQLNLNPRTVNLKLSAMSSFCEYLKKEAKLKVNPVHKLPRPKEKKPLPSFLTQSMMEKYLQSCLYDKNEEFIKFRNEMIVSVLYYTAIRRSELVNIRKSDIDINRKILRVTGKGDKEREIPLFNSLLEIISLYLKRKTEEFPKNDIPEFFVTAKGKALRPEAINKVVSSELNTIDASLSKKTPHVLRHTLATHLINNGVGLNSIKELLGHSSIAATQVYTHNSFEELKTIYLNAHPRAKNRR